MQIFFCCCCYWNKLFYLFIYFCSYIKWGLSYLDSLKKQKNYKTTLSEIREMIKGTPKEKCARCQQLGIFICEHKTPVRDKYRNMQLEQGKFYESPRDYEDLLQPSIYQEPNAFGGDSGLHSHNALSFHRLLINQKKFESELEVKKLFDLNNARKKEMKKKMKLNSLRPNNQSLSRLSRVTPRMTPRNAVKRNDNKKNPIRFNDQEFFTIPPNSSNGNYNNNNSNSKPPSGTSNNKISDTDKVEDLNGEHKIDVNDNKGNNEKGKSKKDEKGGCCTVL